ncbi:MAG: DUF92 domain-containing protein [Anaerolineae bacterium]|nr:DUF92 domain-containing protein [Anaerolineae bacterium]
MLNFPDRVFLQLIIGLALATLIAALSHRRGALTSGGAAGAILVGTITFGFGGWVWGLVLVAFFTLSSVLSNYRQRHKEAIADKFQKGARRDLAQVLANGGLAAMLSFLYYLAPHPAVLAAFLGALASVNADTWGTEIGTLTPAQPRLITTGRQVPTGTSGGVTLLGTAASAMGGVFIGLLTYLLLCLESVVQGTNPLRPSWVIPTALIGGLLGSLFDSLLGATVQGIYYCARCGVETERMLHSCGLKTSHLRGQRWLNNDGVNFLSSVFGALVAIALWGVMGR